MIGMSRKSLPVAKAADSTQNAILIQRVRFKVTTCLYLNLINRARSLSTLIAVSVNKDAGVKIAAVAENASAT